MEGCENYFFVTFGGRQFCKVSQGIATIWRQMGLPGHFNLNLQRKLIDSKAARLLGKAEMRRLNAHMTHTEAVSLKTYQGRSNSEAVEDQFIIQRIIGNPEKDNAGSNNYPGLDRHHQAVILVAFFILLGCSLFILYIFQ